MALFPLGTSSICTNLLIGDVHQISFHCHFCLDEKKTIGEQKDKTQGNSFKARWNGNLGHKKEYWEQFLQRDVNHIQPPFSELREYNETSLTFSPEGRK